MKVYLITTGVKWYGNYRARAIVADKAEADAIAAGIKELDRDETVSTEEFDTEVMRQPWWRVGWKHGQLVAEQVENSIELLLELDRAHTFGEEWGFDPRTYYAYIAADTAEAAMDRLLHHTLDTWMLPGDKGWDKRQDKS